MTSRPLVSITLVLGLGILLAAYTGLGAGQALILAAGLLLTTLAAWFFTWRSAGWLLLLTFLSLGVLLGRLEMAAFDGSLAVYHDRTVTLEGTVVREPDIREDRVYYLVRADGVIHGQKGYEAGGLVLARVPGDGRVYDYGDRLRLSGLLTQPQEPGNLGQFDYRKYLARQGIGSVLYVQDREQVVRQGLGRVNSLQRAALALKKRLTDISRQTLPRDQAAIVNGVVFGSQGEINSFTRQIFNEAGVAHILCVSGLNVGLIWAGFLGLLRLFRVHPSWQAPLITAALLFYALLTGLGPAVVRATLMALVLLWATRLGREADWPTSLSLAALVILCLWPNSIYHSGFQLSFAATWGILYLVPPFDRFIKDRTNWPAWTRGLITVSLAAQLGTLPLIACYFNIFSPVSLLANLVAVPMAGFILALGFGAALAGLFVPLLASLVNVSTGLLLSVFIALVSSLHGLPGAFLSVSPPSPALVAAWYLLLWAAARPEAGRLARGLWNAPERRNKAVIGLGVLLLLLAAIWTYRGGGELRVHVIDVGQGDSIYVHTPSGRHMLVDAGGRAGELESGRGVGSGVVVPYLRRQGVSRLDVLVITHPHEDHAGGALAVATSIPVKLAVISPVGVTVDRSMHMGAHNEPQDMDQNYYRLLDELRERGTRIRTGGAGERLTLDPRIQVDIINPPRPILRGTRSDANNASVVMSLRYDRQVILLTGDIEEEAQEYILKSGAPGASVLKVPHHGSRFFKEGFFEATGAGIAVISAGANNRFGHPAPETLSALTDMGAAIYRTDRDGAVIITTDGKSLRVETGRGRNSAADTAGIYQ